MNAPLSLQEQSLLCARRKRASSHITRVLIASPLVWLAGCAPQPKLQQDVYLNRQDCVADWGEEDKCTDDSRSSSGSGNWRTMRVLGPTYWNNERANFARQNLEASRRLATEQPISPAGKHVGSGAKRGGFGSTGRVFLSGGG
jgi:hypothetical protein